MAAKMFKGLHRPSGRVKNNVDGTPSQEKSSIAAQAISPPYCTARAHNLLGRNRTQAMAAGVADHVSTVHEIAALWNSMATLGDWPHMRSFGGLQGARAT
jgi:hypothetical protein